MRWYIFTAFNTGRGGCRILNLKPVDPSERVKPYHTMADNRYCIEYAKTGRSGCKKCKSQIEKGVPRMGKITPNPFSDDGGEMKVWYHMRCMFETLKVGISNVYSVCIRRAGGFVPVYRLTILTEQQQ